MNERELLFSLLRSEVCGADLNVDIVAQISPELVTRLCALAKMHDLAHIPAYALKKTNYHGNDFVYGILNQCVKEAAYRYLLLDTAFEQLRTVLEAAEIPFIPLKGAVLRDSYPEPWMRTSGDIDVLVQEERLEEAVDLLCEKLACRRGKKGDHDIGLHTATGVTIEVHYETIQERYAIHDCRDVLSGIWDDAEPDRPGSAAHHMSDEMFYFYHIAHMAKHFGTGGCGVRSFLDVWILNHNVPHNWEKREQLLREGGLLTFAQKSEILAEVWFSDRERDLLSDEMADYILRAGVYGNNENRAAVGQARMGGRTKYLLLRRVFMPYDYLKAEYPILKKHKWLTPVYQVLRWIRMLRGGYLKKTVRELKVNASAQEKEINKVKEMLKQLDL